MEDGKTPFYVLIEEGNQIKPKESKLAAGLGLSFNERSSKM
jgi:hypothetical protein